MESSSSRPSSSNLSSLDQVKNLFNNENIKLNRLQFPTGEEYTIDSNDLEFHSIIGTTNICVVKKCLVKPNGKYIAVKKVPINRKKLLYLIREIQTMQTLSSHSELIVTLYGISYHEGEVLICMELMDYSLTEIYLKAHKNETKIPEEILQLIAGSLVDALEFCRERGILHRDIKPDNILLNRKGQIKLCDFETSKDIQVSIAKTDVGTIIYKPPERLLCNSETHQDYDSRADIWSFGITLLEVAYGSIPFGNVNSSDIQNFIKTIQNLNVSELVTRCFDKSYSNDAIEFVNKCLENIDTRPTSETLKNINFYLKYAKKLNKNEKMKKFLQNLEMASNENCWAPDISQSPVNGVKLNKESEKTFVRNTDSIPYDNGAYRMNDSSDSSDDHIILLHKLNFSKNPIIRKLEFEPPSLEWRQEKCRELKLSPVKLATEFGPSQVISWDMPPQRIQKIKKDGDCLFRALIFFLTGHDSDILHVRMRYLICKYMEDHRDDPNILSWVQKYANDVMEYLDSGMRNPGKWGTEVEIQVFARMLNCIVAVWNPGYFAEEDQIRWNRYNFYAMEYQPTLFLLTEKSHFNVCLM